MANTVSNIVYWLCPAIICLGSCGNIFSLAVILSSSLRGVSTNQYLISLTTSDTLFLLALGANILKLHIVSALGCQVFIYLLNVASWNSSWLIVCIAGERYFACRHPLTFYQRESSKWTLRIIALVAAIAVVFNLHVFYLYGLDEAPIVAENRTERHCSVTHGWPAMTVFLLDSILVFVLPSAMIVCLNLATRRVVRAMAREVVAGEMVSEERQSIRQQRQQTAATLLIVMPIVFILLSLPNYALRLVQFCMRLGGVEKPPDLMRLPINAALIVYYCNYAIDVLLYASFSSQFRAAARELCVKMGLWKW